MFRRILTYFNHLCIRYTIFPDFSAQNLGVHILHEKKILTFVFSLATCITIFGAT